MAYQIVLPLSHANLHDVCYVSQFMRYISDPSHVVQVDDVHVKDNLTIEASPMQIYDQKVKQLCGK